MKALNSILALVVALTVSLGALAQQQAPEGKKQEPQNAQQVSAKEQWIRQYNEWKPKIDEYMNEVKKNGDQYPDFTKEVKELDQMANTFNQKIARWDKASPEVKAQYADMMKQDAAKIEEQAAKVKALHQQYWPAEKKDAPNQEK
jgi:uncharacterized coiled-coil DUF342 family protein